MSYFLAQELKSVPRVSVEILTRRLVRLVCPRRLEVVDTANKQHALVKDDVKQLSL